MDRFTADNGQFRRLALRALSEGWTHPRELVAVCLSLIALNGAIVACVARATQAWPARLAAAELFGASGLDALVQDDLLRCLLQSAPLTEVGFERLLANIRSTMLTAAETGAACDEALLGFYCAVARQCYENDYVYSLADGETERAQRLRAALEQALAAGQECAALWPVAVGAYFPLHTLANAQALLQRSSPPSLSALFVQQIEEPAEERRLAKEIPALTEIDGEVSRSVRQQYEENPYPRWIKPALPQQHTLLAGRQPGQIPDVLIAGCGTGLSAINFAQQAPDARILAIDLSLSQPRLRQAHGGRARLSQYRIRAGRHHQARPRSAAVRFHRRVRRAAPSRRSVAGLARAVVAVAAGRRDAGRPLQRIGAPERRRRPRADRRARLPAGRRKTSGAVARRFWRRQTVRC